MKIKRVINFYMKLRILQTKQVVQNHPLTCIGKHFLVLMLVISFFGECPATPESQFDGEMLQAEALSPIWDGATVFDGGWIHSNWYGYLFPQQEWILHLEHDWQYCIGENADNVFLYDFGVNAWAYTSASLYPWMYWYGNVNDWTYYYRDGRLGNRWFYLPATGEYRNDDTLNGAHFTESSSRDLAVTGGNGVKRVTDPTTSLVFEAPPDQAGNIRISTLDEAPPTPFPGTGLAIDVSGMDQLSLIVPSDQLPADTFPMVYVYAEVQGAFDDDIGYRERWIGLPYEELPDGSYSFELPITEPDPPATWSTGAYPQLLGTSAKPARHYAISKISSTTPGYSTRRNVELQAATYLLDFIGALKPGRAIAVTDTSDEAELSISFGSDAYTAFNKLRAWSYGRTFHPVIQLRSPTDTNSLAHESGHYLTNLLVGHNTYDALEKAGGSIFSGNHGIRDSIGRNNLLEDYAYLIEYFLKGTGGNYLLNRPDITFGGMTALTSDFPGLEGFAASMMASLHISGSTMKDYLGISKPIAPLGLGYPDIFEIMSKGATSINTLRSNIESSLSSDKQKALQVLLQRIGWCYYVRGTLIDEMGEPVVGASVRNIIEIGDKVYEGEASNVPSKADGSFVLTGSVFGGDSFIEVSMGEGQPVKVPISLDWAGQTPDVVDLGPLVVAAFEESDISFNITHNYTGWPNDFSLNLAAEINVEVQGADNAALRIERTNDLQSHEPWINISVYAPIGSNLTMSGIASIAPSGSSGIWEISQTDHIPWTLEYSTYYASPPEFSTPDGSSSELNLSIPISEGNCGGSVFMFQAALLNDTGGYLSGVEGRINISIFGE